MRDDFCTAVGRLGDYQTLRYTRIAEAQRVRDLLVCRAEGCGAEVRKQAVRAIADTLDALERREDWAGRLLSDSVRRYDVNNR